MEYVTITAMHLGALMLTKIAVACTALSQQQHSPMRFMQGT
jgi:hypothetical protein